LGEDCRSFLSPAWEEQSGQTNCSIFLTCSCVKFMQIGWNLQTRATMESNNWNADTTTSFMSYTVQPVGSNRAYLCSQIRSIEANCF
jgi:hypothetical protein